jgi:amidohydrolase
VPKLSKLQDYLMSAIDQTISAIEPELVAIRHDLHAHPETGFEEKRTSAIVAEKLKSWGLDVTVNVGKTGVVATLDGKRTGNRTIGLRADMDALNIHETTGVPYASTVAGKMHACGHDGHTSILLGAAYTLAKHRDFAGRVHFIFQPAEEGVGGALAMLKDGLLDRFPVDRLYGIHNWPGLAVGSFATTKGAMMAAGDTWTITLTGTGGHGGVNAHLATDVTVAQAQIISSLQTIVSRSVPALQPAVISVGLVAGGDWDSPNVIPAKLVIRGTARWFDAQVGSIMETRMRELAANIASAYGCIAETNFEKIFTPLVNDEESTALAVEVASSLVGEAKVDSAKTPVTGSEDFAYMLEHRPGNYMLLGNGTREEGAFPVHTSNYNFNDAVLPLGVRYFTEIVNRELASA